MEMMSRKIRVQMEIVAWAGEQERGDRRKASIKIGRR
jgi:hypothetical protein